MINFRVRHVAVTASTNDDVRAAADKGEPEGLVICAGKQTAGRGRHGRMWESPEGNLYCSVLLRPALNPQTVGQYSFVAALAIADTVREVLPSAAVTLKWPNDVLVNGKKISGVLLETGADYLIIGMGLNVVHHPKQSLYPSTSLSEEQIGGMSGGIPLPSREGLREGAINNPSTRDYVPPPLPTSPARGEESYHSATELEFVLDKLLSHLSRWYDVMQKDGFAPIRTAWLKHAATGPLTVQMPQEKIAGAFVDIDAQGNLRLKLADGSERAITTGDVFFAA